MASVQDTGQTATCHGRRSRRSRSTESVRSRSGVGPERGVGMGCKAFLFRGFCCQTGLFLANTTRRVTGHGKGNVCFFSSMSQGKDLRKEGVDERLSLGFLSMVHWTQSWLLLTPHTQGSRGEVPSVMESNRREIHPAAAAAAAKKRGGRRSSIEMQSHQATVQLKGNSPVARGS